MSFQSLDAVVSRLMNEMESVYDDTRLNKTLMRDKVLVARASVYRKLFAQWLGSIPGQYYNECCFTVSCQPVCPGAPVTVMRGKIPSIITTPGKKAIKYLGTVDKKHSFEWRDDASFEGKDYSHVYGITCNVSKGDPYFTLTGSTVDVYNRPTDDMDTFLIRGIFSDPFACGCPEDQIFIPEDHIDEIEQQIKYDLASFLLQRKIDKMNNASPDN